MEIGILAGAVSLVTSLVAVGVTAGIQLGKIAEISRRLDDSVKRAEEDRASAKEKFLELYCSRNKQENELIAQSANVASISNQLQKIENALGQMAEKIDRLILRRDK
jgi:seryl-tRNA synthetase